MPAGKRPQDNAMLYTLITFVGLFIIATTIAVIYYVRTENHRKKAAALQSQINELATSTELRKIGTIVGAKQARKSRLGTMVDYLDEMVYLIIGGLPEPTSAEVKVDTANKKIKDTLELLAQERFEAKKVTPETPDNEFVKSLAAEQFTIAAENFDETMKNALPVEKLQEVWKLATSQAGAFKRQIGSRTEKQAEYDIVFVTCEFEKGPLDVKLVYNSERKITGLFFVPTPPEVLKSYQGTPETKTNNISPNTTGLIQIIEKLKTKLDNTTNAGLALEEQLKQLQNRFDDAMAASSQKEQTLLAEKEKYQQQVNDIQTNYNKLKALMEQTSDEQVQALMAQLNEAKDKYNKEHDEKLKIQAELRIAKNRMERAQKKLQALVPPPDSEMMAFRPDGKIILIDDQTKTVHLNIGSDAHVYQGLTFSVYDKNMPIPKDGKGKAEIEVFDVGKYISAARIIPPENYKKALNELLSENIDASTIMLSLQKPAEERTKDFEEFAEGSAHRLAILNNFAAAYDQREHKKPIVMDDIIANLIWDSDKTNVFVVAGEFDLDGDGNIDRDAVDKIKTLIEKWDGRVANTVTIDTDFLVLGRAPKIPGRPTFEEMEVYPTAMEKYEASLVKLTHYKEVQSRAQALSIPTFNYERFLYFIGYKTQAARAGAF